MHNKLKMNLQFFAEADDGTTIGGLNSFLDGATATDTTATDTTQQTDTTTATDQTQQTDTTTDQTQSTQTQTQTTAKPDKQGHAFAEMRTQNAQLYGLLGKVAQAAGIEFKDNTDLLSRLNDDTLTKLAQKQNIPVELLKRMEQLEQDSQAYQQQQAQQQALVGFQKVKTAYNLTDDELQGFAAKLDEIGKNPFAERLDVEELYKNLYFDDIMNKRVQAAVEAALKKSNAADEHSSTPSKTSGKSDTGVDQKISTVAALNSVLDSMSK